MKLILNGGGDGINVISARKKLNEVIDHTKKCLYIPLAWPDKSYDGCMDFIVNELSDVNIPGIDMITSTKELDEKNYNDYSFIYIGGGNTFSLLKDLKDSNAFIKIKEYLTNGGIVYGGSAGAIIFGKDLDSCRLDDLNKVDLKDITGFDMLNGYSLLCHYTNRDEQRTKKTFKYLVELSKEKSIYAIPEEDTIYVEDNKITFIGNKTYYEFKGGNVIKHDILNLRKYCNSDYEFIYKLKKDSYKKYVEECFGTWDEKVQRELYDKFINTVKNDTYIIQLNKEDIGFYNGETLDVENYEIGNICLINKYQKKGIGTKLLKYIMNIHCNQNLHIQYFKQNPVGKLYERLGFVFDYEKEFHYVLKKNKKI